MATREELAVLAVSAYEFARSNENEVGSPEGRHRLGRPPMGNPDENEGTFHNPETGLEAVAYTNGNEIVISFAGTQGSPEEAARSLSSAV